ncbi:hypothetical protein K438DRAFT_1979235 [Mycena galopus ATCC 62051]|nr:hypothetical protein K438DRAFT_1979235 [Mycena galopus ATCC 62051]
MPQPHTLESAARSSRTIRSLRVTPRPLIRRTTRYQRLINRKAAHETSHSKPAIHALRKRLLRRGVKSGRPSRSASTQEASCARDTEQSGSPAALPIVLPQLPILSLPRLYPETDSGYWTHHGPPHAVQQPMALNVSPGDTSVLIYWPHPHPTAAPCLISAFGFPLARCCPFYPPPLPAARARRIDTDSNILADTKAR